MAFEGLRERLRAVAGSGSDAAKKAPGVARAKREQAREGTARAGSAVAKRAPATGLEGNRKPREPSTREKLAERLQGAGQMRKPIQDANLEPGADPREIESFARGDSTVQAWFGEDEPGGGGDPYSSYFARGDDAGIEFGPFVEEMLDERDHEGGHYAYEDEREEGWLDDGVPTDDLTGWTEFRW